MGALLKFPTKRVDNKIEQIYRREFGFVICPHKRYLPTEHCKVCAKDTNDELYKFLFGA